MSTITQFPSGNTRYRIEFDYLARTFVVVTLVNSSNPTLNRVLEVGRDYRFLNPTMIEMLVDQSGFDIVRIHRQTGTDLVVDFRNGSVLTASDLTNAELQSIHIAEEGRDQTVDLAKEYADAASSSAVNAKDSEDEARRIAASIKASGLIGYITRRSFENGFNVTTWNEVLLWEEDGEYYRWDGTLPKNVPAGSTPESSGGIGLGAWVSVGDATLRSDIGKSDGFSFIGEGVYADIRNYTGSADKILCKGRGRVLDGGQGVFYVDLNDSSTPDDDGVVLIDSLNRRWKRSYSGPISASWFGVRDGTDVTTTLQSAVNRGGGQIFVQDGQYTLTAPIVADFTGASFPVMGRKSKRFDFIGSSMANTTFNTNGNEAFSFTGTDGSVAGQGVHSGARISDFSVYGTNNTGIGVRLVGAAYLKVHDLDIKRTNIAMRISGVLSSDIKRINAQYNNHGMYITSAPNSTVNAVRISGMFGDNSKWAIEGEVGTNVYIEDSNFEGNGTDGDELSGAIYLRVVEPLSTINISGYFEANVGRADILIDNRTSSPLVVNLRGCVFNRGGMRGGSNLGIGAKYNIETRSTGGGPIILNLNGCVFFTQTGFGYVPSANSPYIQPAPYLTVNGEDTCYFSETTSRGETGNSGMTLGISMKADGTMANKPPFLTPARVSAGVYTITHNTRFGTDIDHFQAVATSKTSGFTVSYVQKVNLQVLRIVTLNAAGSPADTDFDVIVTSRR